MAVTPPPAAAAAAAAAQVAQMAPAAPAAHAPAPAAELAASKATVLSLDPLSAWRLLLVMNMVWLQVRHGVVGLRRFQETAHMCCLEIPSTGSPRAAAVANGALVMQHYTCGTWRAAAAMPYATKPSFHAHRQHPSSSRCVTAGAAGVGRQAQAEPRSSSSAGGSDAGTGSGNSGSTSNDDSSNASDVYDSASCGNSRSCGSGGGCRRADCAAPEAVATTAVAAAAAAAAPAAVAAAEGECSWSGRGGRQLVACVMAMMTVLCCAACSVALLHVISGDNSPAFSVGPLMH